LVALAAAGVAGSGAPARAQDVAGGTGAGGWSWEADLGATLVSRSTNDTTTVGLARAQAVGVSVGRNFDRLHLFSRGEFNAWRDRRDDGSYDFVMIFDVGVGARFDYGGGRLRSSVAAGGTVLAIPADIDPVGTFGVFADLRPLAYAWPLGHGLRLGVVPLSLTLAVPVLTGIPLMSIQYRTTLFAERDF
jgi:hypothetical protein